MAKYRITGPDGAAYEITAPDNATQAEILTFVQKNAPAKSKGQQDTEAWQKTIDPTDGMSGMEKFNAGIGKAFSDLGLGIRQRTGFSSRADVAEARKLDAPLMQTGAGVGGNLAGNLAMLAPTALIPGANTVTGAGALGATIGLLQPSTSLKEDAFNVGFGAAGGAAGQYGANQAGNAVAAQQTRNTAQVTQNAQRTQAAQNANKAGYVIPPEDIGQGGGVATRVLTGVSGKIKTAQTASQRNQHLTNDLVRQELGIPATEPLNIKTLEGVRNAAGRAYDVVRGTGSVNADQQFTTALDRILSTRTGATRSFPGLGKTNMHGQPVDEIADLVNSVRVGQFDAGDAVDATRLLRAAADKAYAQGDREKGKAARAASDALEEMLDRHLQAANLPDALKVVRDARTTIAKTYSVQKGLNSQTGDVAAGALAKQLEKGKPLSGNLLTVAQTGSAFPKATQALKEAPKALSPLDYAMAVGTAAGTGNVLPLALLGARPAARNMLLSQPMQRAAIETAGTPRNANALLRLLAQEQLTLPAAFVGSNALASHLGQQ
jgi:hypothetical protein